MRSYRQYCSLARTLDVLGDRWTLLIVRELAIRPCRYTDLRDGLPGIATNLLADRLRELQAAGVVTAEAAPPPVATTLYTLTDWGAELRPILLAMGRWGAAGLMTSGQGEDQFRSRWAGIGMEAAYAEVDLGGLEPVTVLIDAGGDPALLTATPQGFSTATAAPGAPADLTLATDPDTTVGLLTGRLHPDDLDPEHRAQLRGGDDALRRFTALTDRARLAHETPAGRAASWPAVDEAQDDEPPGQAIEMSGAAD